MDEATRDALERLHAQSLVDTGILPSAVLESEGDFVRGTVTAVKTVDGPHGPFVVVEMDTEDGPMQVTCARTALHDKIARLDPQPGDLLSVEYRGTRTSKAGNTYHDYAVGHARSEA